MKNNAEQKNIKKLNDFLSKKQGLIFVEYKTITYLVLFSVYVGLLIYAGAWNIFLVKSLKIGITIRALPWGLRALLPFWVHHWAHMNSEEILYILAGQHRPISCLSLRGGL